MIIYQKQLYSPFGFMDGLSAADDPVRYVQNYDQLCSVKYTNKNNDILECIVFSVESKTIIRVILKNNKLINIDYASVPVGYVKKIQWKKYVLKEAIGKLDFIQ